jgi:hypothetical protein
MPWEMMQPKIPVQDLAWHLAPRVFPVTPELCFPDPGTQALHHLDADRQPARPALDPGSTA